MLLYYFVITDIICCLKYINEQHILAVIYKEKVVSFCSVFEIVLNSVNFFLNIKSKNFF